MRIGSSKRARKSNARGNSKQHVGGGETEERIDEAVTRKHQPRGQPGHRWHQAGHWNGATPAEQGNAGGSHEPDERAERGYAAPSEDLQIHVVRMNAGVPSFAADITAIDVPKIIGPDTEHWPLGSDCYRRFPQFRACRAKACSWEPRHLCHDRPGECTFDSYVCARKWNAL